MTRSKIAGAIFPQGFATWQDENFIGRVACNCMQHATLFDLRSWQACMICVPAWIMKCMHVWIEFAFMLIECMHGIEAWDGACMTNMKTWSALMAWLLDCMHACRHEKQACMAWCSACISWGLPKSPRNHIEACRVTRKWRAWGLALKTTTRCLSYNRRLWHKKRWMKWQSSKKKMWAAIGWKLVLTKKISNTFFWRDPIRAENFETNRNFVVHFFVYRRVVQVVHDCYLRTATGASDSCRTEGWGCWETTGIVERLMFWLWWGWEWLYVEFCSIATKTWKVLKTFED